MAVSGISEMVLDSGNLVLGLVWRAANLSVLFIIDCKSVFEVFRCSFQLILHR